MSKPSLSRIATIDSQGGWLENELIVEIAVSRQPAPASAAARYIAAAMPLVMWLWTWIGRSGHARTSAPTSARAAPGVRMPAMSLMARESMPIATCSCASFT